MKLRHPSAKFPATIPRLLKLTLLSSLSGFLITACQRSYQPSQLPVLTAAQQVLGLASEDAGFGYPVRLEGIVTYIHQGTNTLILQESTGSVFVDTSETDITAEPGTRVVV